jgi:hypothetical protein
MTSDAAGPPAPISPPPARPLVIAAALVWFSALAGFALWTRQPLVREGLWTDEAISVYVARAPSVAEFLARNRTSDYTPPLFNVVLAGYTRVAGSGEAALKWFAMSLGLLAAAGATALAWELGGFAASAMAAAFLVNNPILFEMSGELRAYSMSAFLASVSLWTVLRLRRRRPVARPASYVVLTALLILLVYSHVAGGMLTAALCAWGLLEWRRGPSRSFGRGLALSSFVAGASFLYWLPTTWAQARIGLPWEKPLSASESWRSFVARTLDMLPVPQGFEQPFFVLGMAALLGICALQAPRVLAGLRRDPVPLVFLAISGASIWLVLGIYTGQSTRYLIIPAVLAAAVFSTVIGRVIEASGGSRPAFRVAAIFGGAALVVASFAARRALYEGRFEVSGRPKSGVRSLCRAHPFGRDDPIVVVPDFLAPTAWYYCDDETVLRGFTHWERPYLFDPGRYRALWKDPNAASLAVARIGETLAAADRSRFGLVLAETPTELLPLFEKPVEQLTAQLAQAYDEKLAGRFPGRIESVRGLVLTRR